VCAIPDAHLMYSIVLVFEKICAQTAVAVESCAAPVLSEFSPFVSILQSKVCGISSAHLQGSKTRIRQDIRAEPQIIFAVVCCFVPGLSVN